MTRSLDVEMTLAKSTAEFVLDGHLTPEAGDRFVAMLDHVQAQEILRMAVTEARRRKLMAVLPGGRP
jgi:hypothetical protein